ncbi:MAG: ABC transporter ATP-binding protein [Spirochaetia bacterium]
METINAVEMKKIVKRYGHFLANDNIDFDVRSGEIHALLGENGSGKTTLMSILYGLKSLNAGEIFLFGKKVHLSSPNDAMSHGVGMVHQHFMLVQHFSVLENIIMGHEPVKAWGQIDYAKARTHLIALQNKYNLHVDLDAKINHLSVNIQQRVEILKALYMGAKILILDEPTAALTPDEIQGLFHVLTDFRNNGLAVILVTHKLQEIQRMADRCTVIRHGQRIDCFDVGGVSIQELANKMVGRSVSLQIEKPQQTAGEIALQVVNLCASDYRKVQILKDVNLSVRCGEIVGMIGVQDNGLSELAQILPGLAGFDSGEIRMGDHVFDTPGCVGAMMKAGLANIPADRQKYGLVMEFSIGENLVIKSISQEYAHKGMIDESAIELHAKTMIKDFDIRSASGQTALVKELSGGNQQKVIIAREVSSAAHVLLAVNPSRGLDVGAIEFVQKALLKQRAQNKAILLISYEMQEVLSLSDRILVMYRGQIVGELIGKDADEQKLGFLMAGGGC